MDDPKFRIKIGNAEYMADPLLQQFTAMATAAAPIPFHQFRYQDTHWHVLWDKKLKTYYKPAPQSQHANTIPLSVEWVRVEVIDKDHPEGDKICMLILLAETCELIKKPSHTDRPKKLPANLRKAVLAYIEQQSAE